MEIENRVVKFEKGMGLINFYYYMVLGDFTGEQLQEIIKLNKWWFSKLNDNARSRINEKIRVWEENNL